MTTEPLRTAATAATPRGPLGLFSEANLERLRDGLLVLFAVFAAHQNFAAFSGYVFEDSYITYRYAENIAGGHGFVFNHGERVLGTSTPFYTLVLALLRFLGADLELAGGWITAGGLSLVALAGAWLLKGYGFGSLGALYAVVLLWGAGGTLFFWGMETMLYALLLFGALICALSNRNLLLGLLIGLLCVTRYDAVLFAGLSILLLWVVSRKVPWKTAAVAAATMAPWYVFSLSYFGSILPNTLGAKSHSVAMSHYMHSSLKLLADRFFSPLGRMTSQVDLDYPHLAGFLVLLAVPLAFKGRDIFRRDPMLSLLLGFPVLLWLGYSYIGPPLDHRWYLIPGMYFFLLLSFLAWGRLLEKARSGPWSTALSVSLLVLSFVALPGAVRQEVAKATGDAHYRSRVEAYATLARWVEERDLDDLTVFTREPGYFAYLAGNPVVDGAGLVTREIYFHGPKERSTPLATVLESHRPNLVIDRDRPSAVRTLKDYFPLYQTRSRGLFISKEILPDRLPSIVKDWVEDRSRHPGVAELRHPIDFRFLPDDHGGWWGAPAFAGLPRELRRPQDAADAYLTTHGSVTGRRQSILMSPPFHLDFDELSFLFAATDRHLTTVQLLVNGQAVLAVDGTDADPERMKRIRWPVYSWRGKTGALRIVDRSDKHGFVAAGRFESRRYSKKLSFEDFEDGSYESRWERGFGEEPCSFRELATSFGPRFILGRRSSVSLFAEGRQKMVSHAFVIERDQIAMTILDLGGKTTKAKLKVGGKVVRRFTGERSRSHLGLVWSVKKFRGRKARLEFVDNDGRPDRGIGVDDIIFFDGYAGGEPLGSRP